jgi:hypothetical protein
LLAWVSLFLLAQLACSSRCSPLPATANGRPMAVLNPAAGASPQDWLLEPRRTFREKDALPESDFVEVRVTRLVAAMDSLKDKAAIPLTQEDVRYFAGSAFKSKAGNRPYLVRGLFANNTGEFSVFWSNGELLVQHDSLGHHSTPEFCPLVISLPSEPAHVFVVVNVAE